MVETVIDEMKQHENYYRFVSEVLLTRKIEEPLICSQQCLVKTKTAKNTICFLLTEGMQDPRAETAMQHFADGVILFNTIWASDVAHRDIMVKKMKGTFVPSRSLPYSIGKRGFLIETATRIT